MADSTAFADGQMFTLGQLVDRLKCEQIDVSSHQLKYAIEQHDIEPITRVGIIRVWSEESIPLLKKALAQIRENRGERL